ncbi:hypothetical protein ACGFW5_31365 [Streptomyces sp. NPDC048416]|uniref:hypothetical protein n=1 Tax=Streptomyces sp. NPDC048416 TaxID=3365546 RepID=UPI0037168496
MPAAAVAAPGALLLCRAEPAVVRPVAQLLREPMLLASAGEGWSVLVPAGRLWPAGTDPVDQVLAGWAGAVTVGTGRPAIALWWDGSRAGYTLASGFRRTVGYVWLSDGTPAGESEAMHTFADRLGLDPVHDAAALDALTRPDPVADAGTRLIGLLAVLARTGVVVPAGLTPGEPAERLRAVASARGAETVEWPGRRDAVRVGLEAVERGPAGPWVRGPKARLLGAAQLAAGLPLTVWGLTRRSGGWTAAGAILLAHGALGLAYDRLRARADGDD